MNRLSRQRGFTLIELMISGAITFLLLMACMALLEQSATVNAGLQARLHLNAQARQVMGVISDGGAVPTGTTGTDGTRNIYGLHGMKTVPTTALRQNYQLTWSSNGLTRNGDTMASMTVTCKGPANPMPDCTSVGTSMTVAGWLGADPVLNSGSRSVGSSIGGNMKKYTAETTITLTNPYRAQRAKLPAEATDTYRSIYSMNREANPSNQNQNQQ